MGSADEIPTTPKFEKTTVRKTMTTDGYLAKISRSEETHGRTEERDTSGTQTVYESDDWRTHMSLHRSNSAAPQQVSSQAADTSSGSFGGRRVSDGEGGSKDTEKNEAEPSIADPNQLLKVSHTHFSSCDSNLNR